MSELPEIIEQGVLIRDPERYKAMRRAEIQVAAVREWFQKNSVAPPNEVRWTDLMDILNPRRSNTDE